MNTILKRVISLILCFVLVAGYFPVGAFAAENGETVSAEVTEVTEETTQKTIGIADAPIAESKLGESVAYASDSQTLLDAAIFCSDVHGSTSDLTSVLGGVKTSGVDYSSIGFVGDTCLTVANTTSIVQSALSDTNIAVMFSYASSHDTENSADISTNWDYSGEVEGVSDYYLVYTIRETDMQNSSGAATAAPAFTTWYNGLTDAEKALPIFIMSHRPLHDRRDDNAGAATWYDAISAAAETSDITVFWGHNHTGDNSVDQAAYYVAKDGTETMTIYNGDTVTPNFTYMNAGYINANNQNPARLGVATTVKIYADEMVFQDYNSSGEYTGSYAHNVTVAREFAAEAVTLSSIAVTTAPNKTEYYVGDAFSPLGMVVTATYSDGTTKTVDYSYDYVDTSQAGTATVTVSYEEGGITCTATTDITIKAVELNSIAVTTQPTKLTYTVGEELDTTGMVVTATYNNGTTAEVTGWYTSTVDMSTAGEKEVTVSYAVDNITYKTTFTITVEEGVAEGVVLEKIEITQDPDKTEYLISQELALDGMVVVATFSDGSTVELAYEPFSTSTVYGGYELYNFSMYVEKAHELAVVYTFGEVTRYDTTTINVWNEDFTDENTGVKVHVADGDYGVTTLNVSPSANTYVASALAGVMKEGTLVAYDITLTMDADVNEDGEAVYALTSGEKTVTLPIPEGVENPVVYYVSDNGYNVIDMKAVNNGDGTVSFTTTHFSTYVIGESTEIEVPENETASGSNTTTTTTTKTAYVLTSSISSGNKYLIVNGNSAGSYYALANNSGSVAATGVTVKTDNEIGTYIELDDATHELWTVSNSYRFQNDGYYLRYNNGLGLSTSNYTTWSYSSNRLSYRSGRTTYYLRYNNGWTTTSSSSSATSIYFYVPTEIEVETETTVSGTYSIVGTDETLPAIKGTEVKLSSTLNFTTDDGVTNPEIDPTKLSYSIVTEDKDGNTVNGDPLGVISGISGNTLTLSGNTGKALVKVSYKTDFGTVTDYITVETTTPNHYSINLHEAVLTEATGVTAENFASGTYYTFNFTTNTYHVAESYVEGTTYYTTPVIQGDEITAPVALKGIEAGDTYSVWAVVKAYASGEDTEGVDVGELGDALHWTVSDESIATIDTDTGVITFTGNNYGTFTVMVSYEGADGKVITDTITISVTDSLYVVPGDGTNDFPEYPNEGAVRFDKTASAVGNFSETGLALVELSMTGVPYTTNNAMDVVVMLDMTGSMSDNGMEAAEEATKAFVSKIVKNEDGTYNDNRVAVYAFNSGSSSPYELVSLGTIKSDTALETANTAIDTASDKQASGGTPFDEAAKTCYDVLAAAKTDGIGNNRQQFCVFMSDGGPTSYEGSDGYTYYGGNNSSGDRAITSYIGGYTSSTSSDWTYNLPTEYYTDQMKADGVTVYTVGLLLQTAPSNPAPYSSMTDSTYDSTTDSLTTIGSHYYFTSTILKNMASDQSKYIDIFSVDNADDATAKFTAIAQSILEAATDVVVEDKIGNDYTVNFSLPGYGTEDVMDSNALDGLSEFYIQVVDYTLDSTTHERTGVYTVLENFTFNLNGTLKSHTVDGVECSSCAHVTSTNGVITAIDGTYFDYKSDSTGEYLTWTAEKLTSTELALQYFAHLDNSTGVDVDGQVDPGTYYTNEYATLTYTNVNGNRVQQEFPVPQLTWYGAQVSYVFYLVNEAGQPVNRAGRVVPFSEAVYVTDVHTYSVVWNDLEQAANLEAEYLAESAVPEVYALYDDDASYKVHVYADEEGVNLNNHFVIGGDVTDEYNTVTNSWTNTQTTYVFNTKADGTKYNAVGTYIANDGSDNTDTTAYLCKGDGTVSNVAWEEVTLASDSDLVNAAYYYLDNGVYTRALGYTEGTVYYKLTDASYTPLSGETQWIPGEDDSTTGGTVINGYIYYVDENGEVYTIVQKTNGKEVHRGFDFANTTVAFAVVWKPGLAEDTVVIDFGLDVVIDVTKNDAMAAGVVGVLADAPAGIAINTGTYDEATKATSVDVFIDANEDGQNLKELKIGTATVENLNAIRFSLDKTNGMQFSDPAVFYYESGVNYYTYDASGNATLNAPIMYSSVTVIPATTIYYEDDFLTLSSYSKSEAGTWVKDEKPVWTTEGTKVNSTQDQDRPGESKISAALDADNNYGYDSAYETMATHSLGSGAKITVDANTRGESTFTFYGTGFDVISLTSNNSGTLTVQVYSGAEATGTAVKTSIVDTYYGMDADGNISLNNPSAIYQVPVMKISGLTYGQYTVKITAGYNDFFNHTETEGAYDLYLDAIRIYDPTGNQDATANDAYIKDDEAWPTYQELRNNIIAASNYTVTENEDGTVTVTGTDLSGAIFIDCNDATTSIKDYVSYGPNNELYLANGQAIAFTVTDSNIADIQLGIKVANGDSVTYEINGDRYTVNTTTDMYYSILDYAKNSNVVTIVNVSGGILSLTNIKVTHTEAPAAESGISLLSMDAESAGVALMMLRRVPVVEEEVPETTVPEETEPEEIIPETTVPEETEPEETVPETSVPESSEPEVTEPDNTELKAAVDAAKRLKEKDYTKDSYEAVKSARKAAEKVLKNKRATQAEIDAALEALNAAVEALEAKPDTSALEKAVDEAKKLKEKDYTKESFAAVKSARKAAEKVLKDKNATQAEIDETLEALNTAMDALVSKTPNGKPGKNHR